jgi:hypothetical protein
MVGTWTFQGQADMGPDKPPAKLRGRETVRALGELWIVAQGRGNMPGGGVMTSKMTVGYDPASRRFVGSWVGSPMAHQFVYEGRLKGKTLTLETTGPDFFNPGRLARYRDAIEVKGPNLRILRSSYRTPAGKWVDFMTCHYTRVR